MSYASGVTTNPVKWERLWTAAGDVLVSIADRAVTAAATPARVYYTVADPDVEPDHDTSGTLLELTNRPTLERAQITVTPGDALWVRSDVSHLSILVEEA